MKLAAALRSRIDSVVRRALFVLPASAVSLSVLGVSCTTSDPSAPTGPSNEPTNDVPSIGKDASTVAPLSFHACPKGYVGACAILSAPLDHLHPNGATIDLHIAKQAAQGESKRQLWLLAGGPGQAGYVFERLVPLLAEALPDTDVFVIDHRGTGYSHRLSCKEQDKPNTSGGYSLDPAQVSSCMKELESKGDKALLPYFTTTQAARDVAFAIQATRRANQEIVVWGGSYGTHWAHRFLQVAPELPTSVVFDGFMTPGAFGFIHYDEGVEEVGKVLAAGCASDAVCVTKMGADPYERTRTILTALDSKKCGAWSRDQARLMASYLVDRGITYLLFPFLHRIERCAAGDLEAIDRLLTLLFPKPSGTSGDTPEELFLNSGILQYNIVLSELWAMAGEAAPTAKELEERAERQVFLVRSSYPASIAHLRDEWPLPPDDYADLPLPVTRDVPLLWLAGGIDPRTPPTQAKRITSLYSLPSQHFVMIPSAGHTPSNASPRASDPSRPCGRDIVESFVKDPRALDTSCIDDVFPILFYLGPAAEKIWGTADDWGDEMAPRPHNLFANGFDRSALREEASRSLERLQALARFPLALHAHPRLR